MNNIILYLKDDLGNFKEITPNLDKKFPQNIQIDSSGLISWKHLDDKIEIPDYQSKFTIVENTTMDMFIIIDEQQKRINELTNKLNFVIKYLK